MKTKTQIAKEKWLAGDLKGALAILKTFKGVTSQQAKSFGTGYECLVHPDFYRQTRGQLWIDSSIESARKTAEVYFGVRAESPA